MIDETHSSLLEEIRKLSSQPQEFQAFCKNVVQILSRIPYYNWVGFYFLEDDILVLGPYVGRPTEHVRIKVGQGICGRAVAEKSPIIVDDVRKESNYLACSLETLSEIVVPIWVEGKIVGEIDIDSDDLSAFEESDREFLEEVAEIVGQKMISSQNKPGTSL